MENSNNMKTQEKKVEETQDKIVEETQDMNIENSQKVNDEENQETTSTDAILTDEANDRKKIVKNTNRIIELLKNVTALLKKYMKIIIAVATIVGAVVGIWQLWPKSPVTRLKGEINQKATFIKTTFNPNAIQIDSSSTPDYQMVKDFQLTALRIVDKWNEINTMEPLSKFKTSDLNMMLNVVASRLDVINNFDKEVTSIQANVNTILDYGNANDIPQYKPSYEKTVLLSEKTGKRDKIFGQAKETMMADVVALMIAYGNNPDNEYKDKFVKAVAPLDELYYNKEILDYVSTLFTWIIELNTSYMDYLTYSQKNKAQ